MTCRNRQENSDKPFDDYCAILLSECFNRSGVLISSFKGNRCWSHSGQKHMLLAEDLAKGLMKSLPKDFSKMEKIKSSDFQKVLKGRQGVIFLKTIGNGVMRALIILAETILIYGIKTESLVVR